MKRLLIAIFFFLAIPAFPQGQQGTFTNPQGGNLIASSTDCSIVFSCVWMKLPFNANTSAITLAGTFSATALVEESGNNGVSFTTVATLSSTGLTTYPTNGLTDIRVRISAFTSGQVGVTISTGVNTGPQGPPGTNGGPVTVGQLPLTGTWAFGGTLSGNFAQTGITTASSVNGIVSVDGVTYPFTNAGVNSAIAAACTASFNQGGEVDLPPTTINVTNLATQLLLSPCPIHLKGVGGEATILSVAGGISSSIPVMRLKTTVSNLAYDLENIEFACLSSPTAGDVMLFDNGGGAGLGPSQVYLHHVIVDTGCFGGQDINQTGSASFAGFAYHVEDSYLESGGINSTTALVDSQLWEHNLIRSTSTTFPCFNHTSLVGSAMQTFIHNNAQCSDAGAIIHQANQLKIVLNQFEVTATCTDGSVIDFKGDTGAIDASEVLSNNINAHTVCTNNINFGANSTNWHVLGNKITMNPTAGCGINIVAGGTGGTIGPNTWGGGGTSTAVCGDTAAARVRLYANPAPGEPDTRAIAPSDTDAAVVARANSATQSADVLQAQNASNTEEFGVNGLTGLVPKYGGIATVSNGVPSELAFKDFSLQTAAQAAVQLYAVPASGAGMYRISWESNIAIPATTSCTLGGAAGFQVTYTDAYDSVVRTTPAWWGGGNNGAAPTSASVNTTANQESGQIIVFALQSTNITFSFGYTSSGATAMSYTLHVKVEAM